MSTEPEDFTAVIEISVTASSPEEAASLALDDLRDRSIGPWNVVVSTRDGAATRKVEVT